MMGEDPSGHVLSDILNVLQRIEVKLDGHEARFRSLEDNGANKSGRAGTGNSEDTTSSFNGDLTSLQTRTTSQIRADALWPSRKGSPTNEDLSADTKTLKIPYGQWSINQLDHFFSLNLSKVLTQNLGDCWGMPDDNRLPLKFYKTNVLKFNAPWGAPCDSYPTIRQPVEQELEFLCSFDASLRQQPGNDFAVVDFDEADNTRIYRLGEDAIGPELEVEPQGSQTAPWSRLVYVVFVTFVRATLIMLDSTKAPPLGTAYPLRVRACDSQYLTLRAPRKF